MIITQIHEVMHCYRLKPVICNFVMLKLHYIDYSINNDATFFEVDIPATHFSGCPQSHGVLIIQALSHIYKLIILLGKVKVVTRVVAMLF